MNGTAFSNAHEAYQDAQYARYMKEQDELYLFDAEVEREQERLGKMTLDDALEELGIGWEDCINGSIKDKVIDAICSRVDDPY